MRWLLLPLLLVLAGATAKPVCSISDFYGVSWIGNPSLRHEQLSRWLTTNGENCTSEQLLVIWNNLAAWAGVADSAELRSKLLYLFARVREREDKK
jgi:hypothetical protein